MIVPITDNTSQRMNATLKLQDWRISCQRLGSHIFLFIAYMFVAWIFVLSRYTPTVDKLSVLQNQVRQSPSHISRPTDSVKKTTSQPATKTETERNKKNNDIPSTHADSGRALPQLVKVTETGLKQRMVTVSVYLFCSAQLSTFGLYQLLFCWHKN